MGTVGETQGSSCSTSPAFQAIHKMVGNPSVLCFCDAMGQVFAAE